MATISERISICTDPGVIDRFKHALIESGKSESILVTELAKMVKQLNDANKLTNTISDKVIEDYILTII